MPEIIFKMPDIIVEKFSHCAHVNCVIISSEVFELSNTHQTKTRVSVSAESNTLK